MRHDLGPVTLDTDRHQVFRGAEPLHLSTKAFQLLELLVENRPRALSKDEIQQALWPKTFVSDTSLTTLVHEMKRRQSRLGLATLCVSGGLGIALELIQGGRNA